MLEQLVSTLPKNVRIWVKERKPKTSTEAGQLADDYTQARKQNSKVTSGDIPRRPVHQQPWRYQRGGRQGHAPRDCHGTGPGPSNSDVDARNAGGRRPTQPRRDLSNVECFNCHNTGHYSANCPHNALFCRMPGGNIDQSVVQGPEVLWLGKVQ